MLLHLAQAQSHTIAQLITPPPPSWSSVSPTCAAPPPSFPRTPSTQLFFARAPHSTTENDVKGLFSRFGRVEAVKCFRPGGPLQSTGGGVLGTKGCGLVKMASPVGAEAAIKGLHESFTWGGMPGPMVSARVAQML